MGGGELVLITGTTGFLGFKVLREALKAGYHVRAAVRSTAKAEKVRRQSSALEDQLSFVVVPDFVAKGAFDEAVQGVRYVIHVASPMIDDQTMGAADQEETFVRPAVEGTLGMFESARKAGSVRRIVVTSSILAVVPFEAVMVESSPHVVTAEDKREPATPPYGHPFVAYMASKTAALNRAEAWIRDQGSNAGFDAVYILPSFIIGRDETAETTADLLGGTNGIPLRLAIGTPNQDTLPYSMNFVEDTAKIHVVALDANVGGNQRFIVTNDGREGGSWEDVRELVEKSYPDEVAKGIFQKDPKVYNKITNKADIEKTEKTFGFKLASPETAVRSILDQYVELLAK